MDRVWPERVRAGLAGAPPGATGVLFADLAALRRNYRTLRDAAPSAETAGVVKADAYGLGAGPVVSALKAEGCKTFFAATLDEAQTLKLAQHETVYVLDGLVKDFGPAFSGTNLRPVLNSLDEIEEWLGLCRASNRKLPAAI